MCIIHLPAPHQTLFQNLFLLLVLLNCMFLNDNRPISVLPWSGPKNYIQFCYTTLKLVLSVFYVFSGERPFYDIKIFVIRIINYFCS